MGDNIQIIIRRDTLNMVPRNYLSCHNIFPWNWVPPTYIADQKIIQGT